jgi:GABA permease
VLRFRNGSEGLKVKMWLFPVLSILTVAGIVAILAQMGIAEDSRSQLILSLLSWAVVIVFYFANRWFVARRPVPEELAPAVEPRRVLVMANETATSAELLDELRPHRCRSCRQLLRRGTRQPDRDRCRGDART